VQQEPEHGHRAIAARDQVARQRAQLAKAPGVQALEQHVVHAHLEGGQALEQLPAFPRLPEQYPAPAAGILDKDSDPADNNTVLAYARAYTLAQVLKQCGDDLTRENVMKQAANLKHLKVPMLLPGIEVNTSPTDFFPIEQMQLEKFDGKNWELVGEVIGG